MNEIINGIKELKIQLKYDGIMKIKSILIKDDIGIGLITNTNQLILTLPENNWKVIKNEYKLEEKKVNEHDYEIDRIISSRSHMKDMERIETLKKLKLEKILYKNFRDGFKLYITDPINEFKLKKLKEVLYNNHDGEKIMNFFEKYDKIENIVDNFIKEKVNWTIGDYNKYYELMNEQLLNKEDFNMDSILLEDDEGNIYMNKKILLQMKIMKNYIKTNY